MEHLDDIVFYATAWSLAAVCGLLVTYRDNRSRPVTQLLAIGALCGMVAVSILGVLVRTINGIGDNQPYYLSIAIAVGLLGEAALKIPAHIVRELLKRAGIETNEKNRDDNDTV